MKQLPPPQHCPLGQSESAQHCSATQLPLQQTSPPGHCAVDVQGQAAWLHVWLDLSQHWPATQSWSTQQLPGTHAFWPPPPVEPPPVPPELPEPPGAAQRPPTQERPEQHWPRRQAAPAGKHPPEEPPPEPVFPPAPPPRKMHAPPTQENPVQQSVAATQRAPAVPHPPASLEDEAGQAARKTAAQTGVKARTRRVNRRSAALRSRPERRFAKHIRSRLRTSSSPRFNTGVKPLTLLLVLAACGPGLASHPGFSGHGTTSAGMGGSAASSGAGDGSSSGSSGGATTSGASGGSTSGGSTAGTGSTGAGSSGGGSSSGGPGCAVVGDFCGGGVPCCSANCVSDASGMACYCSEVGGGCATDSDCCNGIGCDGGVCRCARTGLPCNDGNVDCCSGQCAYNPSAGTYECN